MGTESSDFHAPARWRRRELAPETILLLGSAYLAAFANSAFWRGVLAGRALDDWHTWSFVAAVAVILVSMHFVLFALLATRQTLRPLLVALTAISALASHYMQRYGVVLDASMLRNVLHTDAREAAELVTAGSVGAVLTAIVPMALLWNVRLRTRPKWQALALRVGTMAVASIAAAGALLLVYQDFGSLMRTHKSLRYTINPASLIVSVARVIADDTRVISAQRDPQEPVRRHETGVGRKPTLLVMVVGETARAANFSLNGYARLTNPELSHLNVINFTHVRACGTSTEVSLPCMFSPFGRADYDEAHIRRHESLLHVLSRAGFQVIWLDNQSGCKGVCDGLDFRNLNRETVPGLCNGVRCYDEILASELARITQKASGDLVVVLHQMGNHGPAYYRRYPDQFKRFTPACEKDELRDCSREQIVNAYDNAIAYTDRLLADIIKVLDPMRARFDVTMVYASDHGESLGEKGLFLHGLPYGVAPREQLEVPMLWWVPDDAASGLGVDVQCFRGKRSADASHDNLYHSVMGLLGVDTPRYRPERDLFSDCRTELASRSVTRIGALR